MHILFCYRRLLVLAEQQLQAVRNQDLTLLEALTAERDVLTLSVRDQLTASGPLSGPARETIDTLLQQTLDVDASTKRILTDLLRQEASRLDRLRLL